MRKKRWIMVRWANGSRVMYSWYMQNLIKTDPACLEIMDKQTGEILYYKR